MLTSIDFGVSNIPRFCVILKNMAWQCNVLVVIFYPFFFTDSQAVVPSVVDFRCAHGSPDCMVFKTIESEWCRGKDCEY